MADPDNSVPASDSLPEDSPAPVVPAPDSPAGESGSTAEPERPVENLQAEMNRKIGRVERTISDLATLVASLAQARAPAPAPAAQAPQYTDEQLAEWARAGNPDAIKLLARREAERVGNEHDRVRQARDQVTNELRGLYGRFPVLTDQTHPLTQAALRLKGALMATGRPGGHATDLEAIRRAITDFPDLAAQADTRKRPGTVTEISRSRSAQGQAAIDGAMSRRTPASRTATEPELSQKALEIAKRMGVKDPKKAHANFRKRMEDGKSSLSPTVMQIVRDQE